MTLIKIIASLPFLALLILPFLYKSQHPWAERFGQRLASSEPLRRVYVLLLVLLLISFHFCYLQITGRHYDVLLSSAMAFMLFSQKTAEKVFSQLKRRKAFPAAGAAAIAVAFVPHCLPIAVTLAVVLLVTAFYRFGKQP